VHAVSSRHDPGGATATRQTPGSRSAEPGGAARLRGSGCGCAEAVGCIPCSMLPRHGSQLVERQLVGPGPGMAHGAWRYGMPPGAGPGAGPLKNKKMVPVPWALADLQLAWALITAAASSQRQQAGRPGPRPAAGPPAPAAAPPRPAPAPAPPPPCLLAAVCSWLLSCWLLAVG
jgi:hypothetical protein